MKLEKINFYEILKDEPFGGAEHRDFIIVREAQRMFNKWYEKHGLERFEHVEIRGTVDNEAIIRWEEETKVSER